MKKLLMMSLLLISSVSHAALLEESDLVGRLMIVNQNAGDFMGQLVILSDASNKKIGSLKVKMNVVSGKESIETVCSGALEVSTQELNIFQCNDSVTTAILNFSDIETLPYLLGGLSSAKLSIRSAKINTTDEQVDIKKSR